MNKPYTQAYLDRTPESVREEMETYTEEGVKQLATFLQNWMANEHNSRDFASLAEDKTIGPPSARATAILSHALCWFQYGN